MTLRLTLMAALFGAATGAWAGPADYVYTPTVEEGEREIDLKFGMTDRRAGDDPKAQTSLGFGYGATSWWFTEIYGKWNHNAETGTRFDAVEWENKFQLTETGKYPIDLGVLLEIERPKDRSEGYEFRYGPLLQTEFDKVQLNLNLLLSRYVKTDNPQVTEFHYQWQAKYRWQPALEFGVQGFGDLGRWDHWSPSDEQVHKVGPALFGKIGLGGRQAVRYNVGWLIGASDAAAHNTLRTQIEYEF
jgi:hypothetical protein